MTPDISWDIRREGRAWTGDELVQRRARIPEKFEVIDGRLLWSDEALTAMLGVVLEQAGADRAVRLGDPVVWRVAVQAHQQELSAQRGLWKEVFFGPVELAMVLFFAINFVFWVLVVVLALVLRPFRMPDCVLAVLMLGGLGLMLLSAYKIVTLRIGP